MPKLKRTPRKKISVDQWHHMIAEAAYFRAERRGFQGGCPMEDWLEAEHEISQLYFQPEPSPRGALVFLDAVAKLPHRRTTDEPTAPSANKGSATVKKKLTTTSSSNQ